MKIFPKLAKLQYKLFLEKMIIGVEEPIFIKGIGEIRAKVDSGNGAYNVLHGEDITYQGQQVLFSTYDENGNIKRISKKVHDTITINIGAGYTEDRPIVLFSVKFGPDEYMNVPFSIGNRSTNKNKVLLGKEFLIKELDALIDVSATNLVIKGIETDVQITESDTGNNTILPHGSSKNPSGATSTSKRFLDHLVHGTKLGGKIVNNLMRSNGGDGAVLNHARDMKNDFAKFRHDIDQYQRKDKILIFKALHEQFSNGTLKNIIPPNSHIDFAGANEIIKRQVKNPLVFKLLDYSGNDPKNNSVLHISDDKEYLKIEEAALKASKPILYIVILNGDNKSKIDNILSNIPEQDFNKLFQHLINTLDSSLNHGLNEFMKKINDLMEKENVPCVIALCKGRSVDRKAELLSLMLGRETHEPSEIIEPKINYTDLSKTNNDIIDIKPERKALQNSYNQLGNTPELDNRPELGNTPEISHVNTKKLQRLPYMPYMPSIKAGYTPSEPILLGYDDSDDKPKKRIKNVNSLDNIVKRSRKNPNLKTPELTKIPEPDKPKKRIRDTNSLKNIVKRSRKKLKDKE